MAAYFVTQNGIQVSSHIYPLIHSFSQSVKNILIVKIN